MAYCDAAVAMAARLRESSPEERGFPLAALSNHLCECEACAAALKVEISDRTKSFDVIMKRT